MEPPSVLLRFNPVITLLRSLTQESSAPVTKAPSNGETAPERPRDDRKGTNIDVLA